MALLNINQATREEILQCFQEFWVEIADWCVEMRGKYGNISPASLDKILGGDLNQQIIEQFAFEDQIEEPVALIQFSDSS